MLGLNNIQIIGNLGGTPDMKFLNDGKSQVVNFSVAVNERWKNRDGEPQERRRACLNEAFHAITRQSGGSRRIRPLTGERK